MNWDSIGRSAAAHVDETPTPGHAKTGLRESEQRVTARIVRTPGGEVITEYNIGGVGYKSLDAVPNDSEVSDGGV